MEHLIHVNLLPVGGVQKAVTWACDLFEDRLWQMMHGWGNKYNYASYECMLEHYGPFNACINLLKVDHVIDGRHKIWYHKNDGIFFKLAS